MRSSSGLRQLFQHAQRHAGLAARPALVAPRAFQGACALPVVARRWQTTVVEGDLDDVKVFYNNVSPKVTEPAPTFEAKAVIDGEITSLSLEDYKGKYVVLLFYPKDFTYVCPTEIIAFNDRASEFEKLGAQVIAISTDTEECHLAWTRLPRKSGGLGSMQIPIVADVRKDISASYGVLKTEAGIALRGLFIINPEGILEQITVNNFPVGRSVDETLRLIQAFQFVAEHGEVCPANWSPGDASMKADPENAQDYFSATWGQEGSKEQGSHMQATQHVKVAKSAEEFKALVEKGPGSNKAMVMFGASWCGKCAQIAPWVDKLASEFPDLTFVKVDTETPGLKAIVDEVGVAHLPAFAFYDKGNRHTEVISGYKKQQIRAKVEALASPGVSTG